MTSVSPLSTLHQLSRAVSSGGAAKVSELLVSVKRAGETPARYKEEAAKLSLLLSAQGAAKPAQEPWAAN